MAAASLFTFALLTDRRTVQNLPKQHREKKKVGTLLLGTAAVCFLIATIVMMRAAMDEKNTGLTFASFFFLNSFFLLSTKTSTAVMAHGMDPK